MCKKTPLRTRALLFAAPAFAQVPPTPTPTGTPRLLVTARLTQVSGRLIIACTVKDSSGLAVPSQKVSVQKAAALKGPYAVWMSKNTTQRGVAIFPYAQPTYTWYVRCAAAGVVSASKMIAGKKPKPSPTATPRPTSLRQPPPDQRPLLRQGRRLLRVQQPALNRRLQQVIRWCGVTSSMGRRSTPASGIRLARGGSRFASSWANFSYLTSNVSVANGLATITAHNIGK